MISIVWTYVIVIFFVIIFFKLIRIVPEQETYIIEQFGKYNKTLGSGFHLVVPFIQRVAYKHSLKEDVIDVAPQMCITNDNVQVQVDGILYLKVVDPVKASYGIENYKYATAQLAKTTMRSEIGKLELDRTFSERDEINNSIVKAVDEASDPWGIKVTRYEIKDITPTITIEQAMEQQMRAEREKRAEILASEGDKAARINTSKGLRQEAINISKGERMRMITVAEGEAKAIEVIAEATAEGLKEVASALQTPRGKTAMSIRIAEQYVSRMGEILKASDITVLPSDIANLKGVLQSLITTVSSKEKGGAV
ncbi:MAG: paraslipin [Spirochaetes bacterium]|nr:MAG: paraslipin [Spirochaetota bacterium]